MASFVIDSELFRDQYGSEEMREFFSDRQLRLNGRPGRGKVGDGVIDKDEL